MQYGPVVADVYAGPSVPASVEDCGGTSNHPRRWQREHRYGRFVVKILYTRSHQRMCERLRSHPQKGHRMARIVRRPIDGRGDRRGNADCYDHLAYGSDSF